MLPQPQALFINVSDMKCYAKLFFSWKKTRYVFKTKHCSIIQKYMQYTNNTIPNVHYTLKSVLKFLL